jgi:hypothetical protein
MIFYTPNGFCGMKPYQWAILVSGSFTTGMMSSSNWTIAFSCIVWGFLYPIYARRVNDVVVEQERQQGKEL